MAVDPNAVDPVDPTAGPADPNAADPGADASQQGGDVGGQDAQPIDLGDAPGPADAAQDPDNAAVPQEDLNAQTAPDFLTGTPSIAGLGGQQPVTGQLPSQASAVSPEEQKQYDDFVIRATMFLNDPRVPMVAGKPKPNGVSPRDSIINYMNSNRVDPSDAVGKATALVSRLIYANAKHKGVDYPADVIFHGSNEVMFQLYEIAKRAGVIKNPPQEGSPEEKHLLSKAKFDSVKYFGQWLIDTGQDTPQVKNEAHRYYLDQMKREAETGEINRINPRVTPEQLTSFIARAAQGQAALGARRKAPLTASDFRGMGAPSLVDSHNDMVAQQQQQQQPQESA